MKKEVLEFETVSTEKRKKRADRYGDCGKLLRERRVARGYSQKEFSALIGISNTQYNKIELGKDRPSRETIKKISAYLGTPYIDLVRAAGYNTVRSDNALYDKEGKLIDADQVLLSMYRTDSDLVKSFARFDEIGSRDNIELLLCIIKAMRKEVEKSVSGQVEADADKLFLDSFKALKRFVVDSYASL